MKFNLTQVPEGVKQQIKVGNVYSARGGSKKNSPRMWVLIAVDPAHESVVLLGLDKDGQIVSGVKYYQYTVAKWPIIGECPDVVTMEFSVKMF